MHRKDPDTDVNFLPFPEEVYNEEEDPELFPEASISFPVQRKRPEMLQPE